MTNERPESDDLTNAELWTDEAKSTVGEDRFGRAPFAEMVAARVARSPLGRPSTVFGLVGPWGSGKTSLLNMIRYQLPDDEWAVVDFSPWSALDPASLTKEFLNTLGSAFKGEGSDGKRTRAAVLEYSQVALPLLGLFGSAGTAVGNFVGAALKLRQDDTKPWQEAYEKLATAIEERQQRVLIIADDIDRLDPDELMTLLRVIRLLGRFRNVHYLLAYDQDTIDSILAKNGVQGRSSSFMEKIVQYPFEVPPMATVDKRRLLTEIVESAIVSGAKPSDDHAGEFNDRALELITLLSQDLETPRSMSRFREQLDSYHELLPVGELDPLDFIAVTYLRIFHHPVWAALMGWRSDLIGDGTFPDPGGDPIDWEERICNLASRGRGDSAVLVMGFLFDAVSEKPASFFGKHDRAFSDPPYFERYLISAVASDDVSDLFIDAALTELLAGEPGARAHELSDLIDTGDADLAMLALEKCISQRRTVPRTSLEMVHFVHERRRRQPPTDIQFNQPRAQLSRWAAREMLVGLELEILSVEDAVALFGYEDVLDFARRQAKGETSYRMKQQAPKLVEYSIAQIESDLPKILEIRPKLRMLIDLASFADMKDQVTGILDDLVDDDLALFEDCVASFGMVLVTAGLPEEEYDLSFASKHYLVAFGPEIRARLAPLVRLKNDVEHPAVSDLTIHPSEDEIRDHALRTARKMAVEDAAAAT